jgi:hypothetical protein
MASITTQHGSKLQQQQQQQLLEAGDPHQDTP